MILDKGKLHGLHNKLLLTLLHSEWPKLSGPRVLTILSATGLNVYTVTEKMSILIPHEARRQNRDIFLIFFNIKVCCVVLLESPHRGDSNEYTQYTVFNIYNNIPFSIYKRKSAKIIPNLRLFDFFHGIQVRVRNSRGKRAISVRATEVLL